MCRGGGGLSLPSSLKASERAPLSDQQSPSHTLLYTSIPLQNQTPENLSEDPEDTSRPTLKKDDLIISRNVGYIFSGM